MVTLVDILSHSEKILGKFKHIIQYFQNVVHENIFWPHFQITSGFWFW